MTGSKSSLKDKMPSSEARRIKLVLDFDGTLTMRDTMAALAAVGHGAAQRRGLAVPPWEHFGKAYMDDLARHTENYRPAEQDRNSPRDESEWLASLKPVELASLERVVASGLFDHVSRHDMEAAAGANVASGAVAFRKGWLRLLQRNSQLNTSLRILSVNWSKTWIEQSLKAGAAAEIPQTSTSAEHASSLLQSVAVHAYECCAGLAPRGQSPICTSADKRAAFARIAADDPGDALLVYVGDSATDLDCLLAADLGLQVRDPEPGSGQQALSRTLDRIGVPVAALGDAGDALSRVRRRTAARQAGHLPQQSHAEAAISAVYSIQDFDEVVAWLDDHFDHV